jgi:hypothetical protein
MESPIEALTPERRAMLAMKARLLYGKFCGTGGRGICAESFAVFHIGRGETVVAEDLLTYLAAVVAELELNDPQNRLAATRGLAERVRKHLETIDPHGQLNHELQQSGKALRQFVKANSKQEINN